jgi:hypothetical protein
MDERQRERFWSKVEKTGTCWLWTGPTKPDGYAEFGNGRSRRVHRLAYEDSVGPIPAGLVLDHRCHSNDAGCPGGPTCLHRRCVNPAHLEPTSTRENIHRGRGITAELAQRTACREGHDLELMNNGVRRCRECTRRKSRERKARLLVRFVAGELTSPRHGTTSGAALGCMCGPCRAAASEYAHRYYAQRRKERSDA